MVLGLIFFVIAFIFIVFGVIIKSLLNVFLLVSKQKDNKIQQVKKDLYFEKNKPPQIKVLYEKLNTLNIKSQVIVNGGSFENQDYKDFVLKDIANNIGGELLKQKLIKLNVNPYQPHNHQNEYQVMGEIEIIDKR